MGMILTVPEATRAGCHLLSHRRRCRDHRRGGGQPWAAPLAPPSAWRRPACGGLALSFSIVSDD